MLLLRFFTVILAVMYDQMSNGARVEELQLGECLNYDCLNYSSLEDNSGTLEPRGCLLFVGAAKVVEGAIRRCSAPPRRLRCACYGRDLRADPAEDGLVNALAVLQKLLRPYLISPEGNRTGGNVACAALDAATSLIADVLFVEDTMLQGMDYVLNEHNRLVLPNGMEVYSHFESASEETAFLYEEIFVHKVYQAAVEALQPGDLVVDVGANIGMFSLFASRTLRSSVNSDNICKPLRLLAVEPIRANFDLLVQNAQYYNWDCTAYHCAISTPTVLHSKEEECRENTSGKEVVSMVDVRCCQGGTNQPRQIPAVSTKVLPIFMVLIICILSCHQRPF